MASHVAVLIADPQKQLVVANHYIGGNQVAYSLEDILRRSPDYADIGFNSWGRITPDEMREIVKYRYYYDGLSPETLAEWIERFPSDYYMWCITRDY